VSELYAIVQRHQDNFGPSASEIARRIGAAPQTVSSWKTRGLRALPEKKLLVALAQLTHTPYGDVLAAALRDTGYIPEDADVPMERPVPEKPAGVVVDIGPSGEGTVRGRVKGTDRDNPGTPRDTTRSGAARHGKR